jgi:hypothetical protein
MTFEVKRMMKRLLAVLLVIVTLCGCQKNNTRQLDEEKYNAYLANYQAILDYEDKKESSSHFDVRLVCNKISDTSYRYDLIIDNPKVAMCEIMVLMVEENISLTIDTTRMMPSIGIFESTSVNMIPFQVANDKGYVKGIDLSMLSTEPSMRAGVLVSFRNYEKTVTTKEYLSLYAEYVEPAEPEEQNGQ